MNQGFFDFIKYLPAVLQQPETYFMMIVTFCAYGWCKTLPISRTVTFFPQAVSWAIALLISVGLKIGGSYVYSSGTGIIAAWGASSFYDLAFAWLTSWVSAKLGRPITSSTQNNTSAKQNP